MAFTCEKNGLHVSHWDAGACDAMPAGSACDALIKDVPAAVDLEPHIEIEEVAGELDVPTPVKDEGLTPTETKLVEAAADVAVVVGAKESGAHNTPA